jgi:hypothetical protein
MTLARLAPSRGNWARLQLRPAESGAVAEVVAAETTMAARLLLPDAYVARPVAMPSQALATLQRRHPEAERLGLQDDGGMLLLRTYSNDGAAAVACVETDPLPDLPFIAPPPPRELLPQLLLSPAILATAAGLLQRLGCSVVEVTPLAGAVLGLQLAGGRCTLQLARMVVPANVEEVENGAA